jgi:hypothetical protein
MPVKSKVDLLISPRPNGTTVLGGQTSFQVSVWNHGVRTTTPHRGAFSVVLDHNQFDYYIRKAARNKSRTAKVGPLVIAVDVVAGTPVVDQYS